MVFAVTGLVLLLAASVDVLSTAAVGGCRQVNSGDVLVPAETP